MKRGKRYQEAAKLRDKTNLYDAPEAVAIVKKAASAKFDETIEAHFKMGLDGRHADQQIRGAVVLPNGTGKKVRVLVFAKGDKAEEAVAAGADGLMIEVHNDPANALCDGAQSLKPEKYDALIQAITKIAPVVGKQV